ncbi:ferrous iron transport protein A [Candidatus Dependentiae bacterium]|nr:ferrous iron transport protein A [Candidatus Dependentiae bacterium]
MKKDIMLTELEAGIPARVLQILGGTNFLRKLESLGIRPGVIIRKVSSQFGRGPVTIQVGKTQVAIGYGMAQKISLENLSEEDNISG